jgi:hypothetical protein
MKSGLVFLGAFCLAYGSYSLDHNQIYIDNGELSAEQVLTTESVLVVPANCLADDGDLLFFSAVRYCSQKQHHWFKL